MFENNHIYNGFIGWVIIQNYCIIRSQYYIFVEMNNYQLGSEIRQSDQIMRKLNQIKNAIDGRHDSSPNNLNDYLPNQRLISHSQNPQRLETKSNMQSYRQSLQKKLQRLFKEERKVFNQSKAYQVPQNLNINNYQAYAKHDNKQAFTLQKMQAKIRQLEKRYLHTSPIQQQKFKRREQKNNPVESKNFKSKSIKFVDRQQNQQGIAKKTKSIYEKAKYKKQRSPVKMQDKSEERLLTEIGALKKQIRQIKQSNVQLNQKIEHKDHERKNKKERSRYLLRCILAKLIQIQQQINRRDKIQLRKAVQIQRPEENMKGRSSIIERQKLKKQNQYLIKQVDELNTQLKKQSIQRQLAEQKSNWIENELKKFNKR